MYYIYTVDLISQPSLAGFVLHLLIYIAPVCSATSIKGIPSVIDQENKAVFKQRNDEWRLPVASHFRQHRLMAIQNNA